MGTKSKTNRKSAKQKSAGKQKPAGKKGTGRENPADPLEVFEETEREVPDAASRVAAGEAKGRQARKLVPRASLAELALPDDRPDPVDQLEAQAETRLAGLIPLRYGRMLVSAFTFYRGAAAIMASDLSRSPVTGIKVQACGDAHLSNFGAFASPERRLIFDINDFDETLPGPWEWDIKRLAASFEIGGRDRGFRKSERRQAVLATAEEYRRAMREFAAMSNLDVWNWHLDVETTIGSRAEQADPAIRKNFQKNVAKAQGKDRLKAFSKLTHVVDGKLRIISDPPALMPLDELVPEDQVADLDERVLKILASYRETLSNDRKVLFDSYEYVHAAMKVVGVGSVGTRAWIVLMVGRDVGDPLFLQLKEAQPSVFEPYVGASRYGKHGRRVVEGQKLTQGASDIFLGWTVAEGFDGVERDYYVRQLWDWKGSAQIEKLNPGAMAIYGRICGRTLARAHARTGNRFAISSYLGKKDTFDRAMADFAAAYADQNERDYQAMLDSAAEGRIEVVESDR
jgi:uncharacterized protein (DUF2252 family)